MIFVPSTTGGQLVGKLRKDEDRMAGVTGFRIKFYEAGGSKLIKTLARVTIVEGNHALHVTLKTRDKIVEAETLCMSQAA